MSNNVKKVRVAKLTISKEHQTVRYGLQGNLAKELADEVSVGLPHAFAVWSLVIQSTCHSLVRKAGARTKGYDIDVRVKSDKHFGNQLHQFDTLRIAS